MPINYDSYNFSEEINKIIELNEHVWKGFDYLQKKSSSSILISLKASQIEEPGGKNQSP